MRGTVTCGLLLAVAACASPAARYPQPGAPTPVPWVDTLPIEEPAPRGGDDPARRIREMLTEQPGHGLSISRRISGLPPALNVDPFDDVVPSSWYEPRITARAMTPSEVARGPNLAGPDTTRALRVVEGKVEGVTAGFTVEDARGTRFLLKLDPPGMIGLGSGADVVSSRIFWAAGYNVPKDVVVHIRRSDLVLADDAEMETADGERRMTEQDVEEVLSGTEPLDDGRIRTLASRFVEGTPKGPFDFEGRRSDDPNDYYPHEERRELRALWVVAAWVNHVDLRVQNTLDSYIEPAGYIRHYLIDFATTLGSGSIRALNAREGRAFAFDAATSAGRLFTLGFYRAGWEGTDDRPLHPALGWISSSTFEPGAWKPFIPNEAFRRVTERDRYWGAKIVAAFTEQHVRAVIDEARYPPRAAERLHDILMERRRRLLRHWFSGVSPVEDVTVEQRDDAIEIGFRDLGLEHHLWSAAATAYAWRAGSASGTAPARNSGEQSVILPVDDELAARLASATLEQPLVVELEVMRGGAESRSAHVRLARAASGRVSVSGVIH